MNKILRKTIMLRTNLKNIANKPKSEQDIRKFKDQRNLVVKLNIKAKRDYFKSIQFKSIDNDKRFWKTVKQFFTNKNHMSEKITLIEDCKIVSNDVEIAECLNTHFTNITNSLEIDPIFKVVPDQLPTEQMVMRALDKYTDHKSICIIKEHFTSDDNNFQFSHANPTEVMKQIELLDKSKSNNGSIPTSQLKDTQEIVCPYLTDCINTAIFDFYFPEELKKADVSPIFKELNPTLNSNFRPISVLSSTSKIYERILKDQMSHYFKDKLRDILCRFREGYSTQHALLG